MQLETFARGGRRIKVERRFFAKCLFCEARIDCPDEIMPWQWTGMHYVKAFLAEHRAHGASNIVGFQIEFIEVET